VGRLLKTCSCHHDCPREGESDVSEHLPIFEHRPALTTTKNGALILHPSEIQCGAKIT